MSLLDLPPQAAIMAVTGGRDVHPTEAELTALWRACRRRRVRVLRVGDCPTGVDAAVHAACEALRLGHGIGDRSWVLEQWCASWKRYPPGKGSPAGPIRNLAMLEGDSGRVDSVFAGCGMVSRGRVDVLVAWPGGRGTSNCRSEAEKLGIRVVSISELL